jgi:AcrR family transcriptional regulator
MKPTVGTSTLDDEEERMDRRLDRGRATREKLVTTATELFAERGYEATSIEAVFEQTGVSKGGFYHHFASKQALFEAVVESVEITVGDATLSAAAQAGDVDRVARLRSGCLEWIRLAGDPVVRRILLIDAPAVLGWRRWREIDAQHALGTFKAVLLSAAEEGRIPSQLVEPFSHMIFAAMNELALVIAPADDVPAEQASAEAAIDEFLRRLLPPPTRESKMRHKR